MPFRLAAKVRRTVGRAFRVRTGGSDWVCESLAVDEPLIAAGVLDRRLILERQLERPVMLGNEGDHLARQTVAAGGGRPRPRPPRRGGGAVRSVWGVWR